jgi:hypothetical protein
MQTERLIDWQAFEAKFAPDGPYRSWAFRGQANASWPLWTSLSRHLQNFGVDANTWPRQEARIIRLFKRKAHLYLDHVPANDDVFQWLALMQHHGAPTRLLDFTWSPHVAAFFALELATTDAAVYAVNTSRFEPPPLGNNSTTEANLRHPDLFEDQFLPGTEPIVTQGEPGVMNRRLTAQLGTFIVPGRLNESVDHLIESYCGSDAIVKIILPGGLRVNALRALHNHNVHNASLFPDLNGLAASLRYELETHWAFDPLTGADYVGFGSSRYANTLSLSIDI